MVNPDADKRAPGDREKCWRCARDPALLPDWVVIVALLLYIASFAISIGPLPHVMMSEIFPLNVRGSGMSMASISNWGFNFLVVFAFPLMLAGDRSYLRVSRQMIFP